MKKKIREKRRTAPLFSKRTFWDTEPISKYPDTPTRAPPQGPVKTMDLSDVRPTPYQLPEEFQWCSINLDTNELDEVYELLKDNYIEDVYENYRTRYTKKFIKWAILQPGYHRDCILGIRLKSNKDLVGFASIVPSNLALGNENVVLGEANFCCLNLKYRSKRMTPLLIKELLRRLHMKNIWYGYFISARVISDPSSETSRYHRSLNFRKLLAVILYLTLD